MSAQVNPLPLEPAAALSGASRFAQRVRRRYAAELAWLPAGAPDASAPTILFDRLRQNGLDVGAALRVTRQVVLERLLTLDCDAAMPLREVCACMTHLAEFALDIACKQAFNELDVIHGVPVADNPPHAAGTANTAALATTRTPFWILGMGKLGGHELNVSSDIDLIYVYADDGQTTGQADGRGRISNQAYFAKCARALQTLVGEVTEHGFVFRLDIALRPNGNSGPPAISLDALEEYFMVQGREWERFAWLKARWVAPVDTAGAGVQQLRKLVVPFVFRRYLDYGVFDALRGLHQQIRDHASRRSAGRPERSHDVKLSRGGIREIEFIVQLLQVVRGGQFPELRTRSTQNALQHLAKASLMAQETAHALSEAYAFLRRTEHRIQYLDDQQTHVLPTADEDLLWIAHTMGYPHISGFLTALDAHRERVSQEFDILLGGHSAGNRPGKKVGGCVGCGGNEEAALALLPVQFRDRLDALRHHPRVQALREESAKRLQRLLERTAGWLTAGQTTEQAALRFADWLEPLLRRESYLAMLVERPQVHERLLRLLGAARWPARYLLQHPGVIDELASNQLLLERFSPTDFERDLNRRRDALERAGEGGGHDEEALLNLLRRAHHAETFRTLARDVERVLTVEQVADDLSALAESVLRLSTQWCWEHLKTRHRDTPSLAILAYGKLGGIELGYGSDLDIVFVYDDPHENASEIYAALVRKLITWLTVKTGEGDLYEIDTALRPNGSSGMLVTHFDAFATYQEQRGSNTAWTWEHQAMTRARLVLGTEAMRSRFEAIRQSVITAPRDPALLKSEIRVMRERVRGAHAVKAGHFDVKHSLGGMMDTEFAVQYLVLAHGYTHPGLRANRGNIALLEHAQDCGLLPTPIGHAAADAYRHLRQVQHRARLDELPTSVADDSLLEQQQAGLALWDAIFDSSV